MAKPHVIATLKAKGTDKLAACDLETELEEVLEEVLDPIVDKME